ncbi:MAG: hypothetical protein QF609_12960, partial [Gammaproteobacteria bacterium]|nr:hypothetical protein [Gammaproteobacteria bacterium]
IVIPAKATAMAAPWHPAIAAFVHPCTSDVGIAHRRKTLFDWTPDQVRDDDCECNYKSEAFFGTPI